MTFGEFLKQKRLEKNLTQKELSKLIFISESAISKWEKNVARPDISLLPKLSSILGVSEHELITASIDNDARTEQTDAKRWRNFSKFWQLFFYIGYGIAIATCFICNLAVNKTLSWFFIVLSALLLSFSITNLPKYIKKHKVIFIPLSIYIAISLLLGVCAIYTKGAWFFIPVLSVLLFMVIIFMPIYISKYKIFEKVKKFNAFISVAIDFVLLNLLLLIINVYTVNHTNNQGQWWYLNKGLPISLVAYLILNVFLCVKFLPVNKLIKTSVILFLINVLYLIMPLIKVKSPSLQEELNGFNVFKANLSVWKSNLTLENNIQLIIFLTVLILAIIFLIVGLIKGKKNKIKQ